MQPLAWMLGIIMFLIGGFYLLNAYVYNEEQGDMNADASSPVEIVPIEHATGVLLWDETVMYFDPVGGAEAFAEQPAADIILVTDVHGDHLSTSTLAAVRGNAALIVPRAVHDMLPAELAGGAIVLENGQSTTRNGFRIEATPMYNLPDAGNADRHVRGRGNGYLIEKDGYRVLIAGDTAGTPELRAMRDIDIALIPMNLPYTMGVDEAADVVLQFKPKIVYPYHYRQPDGLADVARFKRLVNEGDPNIDVVLAGWYE
jgi:L-ascorbate metabolism protein UlaG (beta-lactamase superfamily)